MEQLDYPCTACGATGRIENPEYTAHEKAHSDAWERVLAEAKAAGRRGASMYYPPFQGVESWPCANCAGEGFILTDAGRALYGFLRRWAA